NRHSLPTNIESVESGIGEVGPKLLVVARGVRGLGQNMGSTMAPRHLVTAIYDTPSPGARAIGSNLPGADGARKSKSQMQQQPHQQQQQSQQHHQQQNQSTPRNLGGGVKCCYSLAELMFPIAVQRRFRQEYGANAPDRHTIMKWYNQLLETGSLLRKKGSGKKPAPTARVEDVRQTFQHLENPSPTKPPPWMRKQRKKRPTPGNKKKRNKSSGKRGHCFRKRLKGTSSACDLTTEGDIDSPMILKLRQQVLQTATTIQLACGKQKAILPNVEPELTHVNKKKNEMVCCIQ
ncbi:hypothetical protein C0J52_16061, partial [Blattella germanica]